MAEQRVLIRGEIDPTSSAQLSASLAEAVTEGDAEVLLDCSQVTFIDSTGVYVILEADRLLAAQGREMRVVNVSPFVRRIFDVLGLTELIHLERGLISN
jgi:anti-sigma B factor antagonist